MSASEPPTVLVVDDDAQVLDLYVAFLEDAYRVIPAESGEAALARFEDDVDVVLLDRRMPDMSGREVLQEIRERDRSCRVAMVTAIQPDLDVIDMEFDDYLVKPVTRSKLHKTVDSLLNWDEYDSLLRNYFETAQKIDVLESGQPREVLESSEEYQQLRKRLASLRARAETTETSLVPETLSTIADGERTEEPSDESPRSLGFPRDR